jgi:hypothetical protein
MGTSRRGMFGALGILLLGSVGALGALAAGASAPARAPDHPQGCYEPPQAEPAPNGCTIGILTNLEGEPSTYKGVEIIKWGPKDPGSSHRIFDTGFPEFDYREAQQEARRLVGDNFYCAESVARFQEDVRRRLGVTFAFV